MDFILSLAGTLSSTTSELVRSEDELMLQCTSLPRATGFPQTALQMDLQSRPMPGHSNQDHGAVESQQCEQTNISVGCVSAVLENNCSTSPESALLRSASVSPSLDDQECLVEPSITMSDGQPVQHWTYEEQFRQVSGDAPSNWNEQRMYEAWQCKSFC